MVKDYEWIDWGFLRLVLLHISLILEATNWIMLCMVFANYVVLINGEPTQFFKGIKGIYNQGCPLFPLLLLLMIEGLSCLIEAHKLEGRLKGVKA